MCKKVTSERKLILVYLSLLFFSYSLLACTFHETNFIVKASILCTKIIDNEISSDVQ